MGWLFGNKDNSRTETKTVNDNGKLKELQLTITGPDSTMVVTGDEYRTTVPLRGNQPVAAEEVSIERKAPNGMWLNSLIPFYDGDVKGTQKKARSLWQLPEVEGKSQGGWMNKFQNGGSTQPTQDLAMKELMAIVQQAATELQSNKPGQGVQTLAQIANDPQGSQLLDVLVQQVPEAGQIVEAVMKMVGAFKCGGKAKKKVKKGAKGCVPCKKLMRVGGKLVNVWSDCEGNIISKHQTGGWLIPKGLVGLTAQFVQEPYRKAKAGTDAGNANDVHYYLNDDNKIYMQTYVDGQGWGNGLEADMNNFKNWATTANTSGQILGKNFFVNGFNFDYNTNMGTMSKDDALTAGIDVNQFKTSLGGRGKYEASYNPLFGESKPSEVDITQGYINSLGGMNAAVKHERQQRRKDRRAQRAEHRAYNSAAGLSTKDTDTSNDVNVLTTDQKLANLNNIDTNYANEASRMAAAMRAKWSNYNVGTPASTTPASSVTNRKRDVLKQGGWLTKFLDGGMVKGWYVIPGNDHISEEVSYRPFSLDFIKKAIGVTPGELNPNYRNRTVIKYTATRPGPFEKNKEWKIEKITFDPNKQLSDTTNYSMYVPYPNPNPMHLTK